MATVANVVAKFEADTSDLQAGARRVNSAMRSIDDGVKKSALGMNALKAGFLGVAAAAGMFALKMGIDGIKAAAEEEKAVIRLATALENVGQSFRLTELQTFVDDLQRATGVADDELFPALQSLVTATGDVTKAQDLLTSAMDISTATGRDLTSVSVALAKASNGQFTQLNRLTNGAINPAILATKDMTLITAELNKLFGGQAQASAETFAGKLKRLEIAYNELLEAFGEGFIGAFTDDLDSTDDFMSTLKALEPDLRSIGETIGTLVATVASLSGAFKLVGGYISAFVFTNLAPIQVLANVLGLSGDELDATAESAYALGVTFRGPMSEAARIARGEISGIGDDAEEAAQELAAMQMELEVFLASVGAISAVDQAAASIDNIGAASVEFGTNLMGQTPKARDFRAEVISAFEDSARAAASLSDDLPTQRAIFTGELIKIVAALRASGVTDSDIEAFLGSMNGLPASVADIMRSAAKAVGDTDFKTQVEKAFDKSVKAGAPMTADAMARLAEGASKAAKEELGLTLEPQLAGIIKSGTTALRPTAFLNGQLTGKSIGSGLANGVLAQSPTVQAAIRRVIQQAHAAAKAEAESTSPSRLFARLGDDIGSGLAIGITRSTTNAEGAAKILVDDLVAAFNTALAPAMGPIQSAFAGVFANLPSLEEAKRAVKEIGWDLADARDRVADAERAVRDAKNQVAQAEKAVADARKSGDPEAIKEAERELNRVRKEAPRDIAAAERDLARARQAVLDVTKELGIAQDNLDMAQFISLNRDAVDALMELVTAIDKVQSALEDANKVFEEMGALLDRPFGIESDLFKMFSSSVDIEGMARNYQRLVDLITRAFAMLTDVSIVGEEAAAANVQWLNNTIGRLNELVAEGIALRKKYQENLRALAQLEKDFQKTIERINKKYDELDKAGAEHLASLEQQLENINETYEKENSKLQSLIQEREQVLESISDGFRSFVNNFTMEARRGTTALVQQSKQIAEGISLALEVPDPSQSGLSGMLRSRLDEVKQFADNIRTLVARGLDPAYVQEMVSAGVSNAGEMAAALAASSDSEIQEINSIQSQLRSVTDQFAQYVSSTWYNASIEAQQATTSWLENEKNSLETLVSNAKAYLEELKTLRAAALEEARKSYEAERARLEEENMMLLARMDEIATEIEALVADLYARLPPEALAAGQGAIDALLAGFKERYPEVYKELNELMDRLAESLKRTVYIDVEVRYGGGGGGASGPIKRSAGMMMSGGGGNTRIASVTNLATQQLGKSFAMASESSAKTIGQTVVQSVERLADGVTVAIQKALRPTVNAVQAMEDVADPISDGISLGMQKMEYLAKIGREGLDPADLARVQKIIDQLSQEAVLRGKLLPGQALPDFETMVQRLMEPMLPFYKNRPVWQLEAARGQLRIWLEGVLSSTRGTSEPWMDMWNRFRNYFEGSDAGTRAVLAPVPSTVTLNLGRDAINISINGSGLSDEEIARLIEYSVGEGFSNLASEILAI